MSMVPTLLLCETLSSRTTPQWTGMETDRSPLVRTSLNSLRIEIADDAHYSRSTQAFIYFLFHCNLGRIP